MFDLRRTSAPVITNVNGQTVRVGESLSYGEWKSMKNQRDRMEPNHYAVAHCKYAGNLGVGVDGETGEARRNMVYVQMVVLFYKQVPPSRIKNCLHLRITGYGCEYLWLSF